MATYKVIQDIEADDTLLGPLSPRQVVYAAIVVISGFIIFKLVTSPAGWAAIFFLPQMLFFGLLAAPFGHDQPNEVWLLAKVRFMVKPRRRIWDQSGVKQLVTVTAPRKIQKQLTKGYSQTEVKSRLEALAATIDSRGWAVKNVNAAMIANPTYGYTAPSSDRLIDLGNIPQEVPAYNTQMVPDMMDERTSQTAINLTNMINASTQAHRQQILATMSQGGEAPRPQPLFLAGANSGGMPVAFSQPSSNNPITSPSVQRMMASAVPNPSTQDQEQLLTKIRTDKVHEKKYSPNSRLKTIVPADESPVAEPQIPAAAFTAAPPIARPDPISAPNETPRDDPPQPTTNTSTETNDNAVTAPPDPAILMLASNDDLNVETIARQAKKATEHRLEDGEVVINLH